LSEEVECSNGCELTVTSRFIANFIGGKDDGERLVMPILNDSGPSPYIGCEDGTYYDLVGPTEGVENSYDYEVRVD